MTMPFAASLRVPPRTLRVGAADSSSWHIRVEVPEVWDVVRIQTSPQTGIAEVKAAALRVLFPEATPEEFVTKLGGFEVLDEEVTLAEAGMKDGAVLLLTFRRRRPVR